MRTITIGNHATTLTRLTATYDLDITAHFGTPESCLNYVPAAPAPQSVIIDIADTHDPEIDGAALQLLDEIKVTWSTTQVALILGEQQGYLDELFYEQVRTFSPDQTPQIADYLNLERTGEQATVIMVANAKGGVGKSSAMGNIAVALVQRHNRRVVGIDADAFDGNLAALLGVPQPSLTLPDLLRQEAALTAETVGRCLTHTPCGVDILAAPATSDFDEFQFSLRQARAILLALSERYHYICIDTPPDQRFSTPLPAAVWKGDIPFHIFLILQPQPLARDGAQRMLALLRKMQITSFSGLALDVRPVKSNPSALGKLFNLDTLHHIPHDLRLAKARQATDLVYDYRKKLDKTAEAYARVADWLEKNG